MNTDSKKTETKQCTIPVVRRSSLSREEILKIANELTNRVPDKIHRSDMNDMEHIKANLKAAIILQLRKMNYA
jgi:predicted translin family RNA/ssDNA-binding protein